MSTRQPLRVTIIAAIIRSRLTSVETVVSVVAVVTGAWLVFPYWDFSHMLRDVTGLPEAQLVIAAGLIAMGLLHLASLAWGWNRRGTSLGLFMAMVFLTLLSIGAVGGSSVIWIPFLALAVLSGLAHLSHALGYGEIDE